jgi:hypothetical protein|tara:strand:+ start:330 stop:521 length:192 start_codon:yes stop_codon:yes gene_type:complete
MKTWLLITTIFFTTPEKDFSGVVIHEFEHKVECDMRLEETQNIDMVFDNLISIKVETKCEEKI